MTHTTLTHRDALKLDRYITHLDLRTVAHATLHNHPEAIADVYREGGTETLVVGDRAGQASGGNASWGDWREASRTLRLDERGPEGEVLVVDLAGGLVALEDADKTAAVHRTLESVLASGTEEMVDRAAARALLSE